MKLAELLREKGLVATAEVEALRSSFRVEGVEGGEVYVALSCLPVDASSPRAAHALQHLRAVLRGCEAAPRVAELALRAFSECVAKNGIDSKPSSLQASLVELFSAHLPMGRVLERLLSPPVVDLLDNLHVLTLVRWFHHCQYDFFRERISRSILSCSRGPGSSGLACLPKIIAGYALLRGDPVPQFLESLKREIASTMDKTEERALWLLDLVMQAVLYLLAYDQQQRNKT